ncbi:MAG: hypothetical protein OEQ53_16710, partial [Saprospiraceae bacterium]|nr:hypothetical protein [Saprospiraceae bacterium]
FLVERVIGGNVYKEGDELVFECTITNASTKKVIHGLPTVRCSIDDPMQGIDELKQLLLGALASEEDKDRNLLLETSTPKFEAYKELELAKAADDDDRELFHLNRAIAIDSTYFEALVLRLSHYYNEDEYAFADSLMEEINLRLLNMDPRQRNLMNFYDALLKGRNNLIFKHLNDELRLAPFDLITNTSMVVLGLQFTNEVQKALAIYQEIPEQDLDYSNCSRCRTRLYLKMQIDLEQGNPDQAIESGQTLVKNGGWDLAYKLMVRAYVRTGNWEKVEQLGQVIPSGSTAEDPANHALTIAKECLLIDDNEHATHYVQVALSQINPKTTEITRGEILLLSGDHDGAADVFSELVGADSLNFTGWSYLAATKFNTNDQEQGSSIVQWLDQQKGPFQFGEIDYLVARALMIGGQSEAVIPRLRRSVEQGRLYQFHFFHNDFVFAPIHQDTEFVDLLEYWH